MPSFGGESPLILCDQHQIWHTNPCGEDVLLGDLPRPHPKEAGPQCSKNFFGTQTHAKMVYNTENPNFAR